jgi:hypothetical protein
MISCSKCGFLLESEDPADIKRIAEKRRKERDRKEIRSILEGNKEEEFVAQLICIK